MRKELNILIILFIIFILIFLLLSYISPLKNAAIEPEGNSESAQSILYFNPSSFYSSCDGEDTYFTEVFIKTQENKASEIQIELSYNPEVIYNVNIRPENTFFAGETEQPPLLQEIRENLGRVSLAVQRKTDTKLNGISLALLSFQINSLTDTVSQIKFLDKSAVFSGQKDLSLLKETIPLTIYCSKTSLPKTQVNLTPGN